MKFVSALLVAAIAFAGINAKCVEQGNERFFVLTAASKAKAEEFCVRNGGRLADVNKVNYNEAASAVAACTNAETSNVDVWIKSWNGDSYNNVGILMNVNKESKGFTIHQYFEYSKRDDIFTVEDEDEDKAVETEAVPENPVQEEPIEEEPFKEEEPVEEEPVPEQEVVPEPAPAPVPVPEPVKEQVQNDIVDNGTGRRYEVLCQVA